MPPGCVKTIREQDITAPTHAVLFGVTTSNLNKAVNRNIERFPKDFMLQLSAEEFRNLKFHFGTSSWGVTRKPPRAFTECQTVYRGVRLLLISFSISTAMNTTDDNASVKSSSFSVKGSVLNMGFNLGT
jgi:hypothetical protein